MSTTTNKKEKTMNRSEVYFLMKMVENSKAPAWVNREELIKKLQDMWIDKIHQKKLD